MPFFRCAHARKDSILDFGDVDRITNHRREWKQSSSSARCFAGRKWNEDNTRRYNVANNDRNITIDTDLLTEHTAPRQTNTSSSSPSTRKMASRIIIAGSISTGVRCVCVCVCAALCIFLSQIYTL